MGWHAYKPALDCIRLEGDGQTLDKEWEVETGAQSTGVQQVPEAHLWLRPHCLRVAWGQVRAENQAGGCHPEEYYVSPGAVS